MTDEGKKQLIDAATARMASADGLDWSEVCAFEADPNADACDSSTCVAAHFEDHDPGYARQSYRRLACAALEIDAAGVSW